VWRRRVGLLVRRHPVIFYVLLSLALIAVVQAFRLTFSLRWPPFNLGGGPGASPMPMGTAVRQPLLRGTAMAGDLQNAPRAHRAPNAP
jgi:hypothetical protein